MLLLPAWEESGTMNMRSNEGRGIAHTHKKGETRTQSVESSVSTICKHNLLDLDMEL